MLSVKSRDWHRDRTGDSETSVIEGANAGLRQNLLNKGFPIEPGPIDWRKTRPWKSRLGRNLGRMGASAKGETLDLDDSDEFATSINVGFGPGNSLWAGQ